MTKKLNELLHFRSCRKKNFGTHIVDMIQICLLEHIVFKHCATSTSIHTVFQFHISNLSVSYYYSVKAKGLNWIVPFEMFIHSKVGDLKLSTSKNTLSSCKNASESIVVIMAEIWSLL